MIFERSVNGIFGCIIFCVLLRSPQYPGAPSRKDSLRASAACHLQLQHWRREQGAQPAKAPGHLLPLPVTVTGRLLWSWLLGPGARGSPGHTSAHHRTHSGGQMQSEPPGRPMPSASVLPSRHGAQRCPQGPTHGAAPASLTGPGGRRCLGPWGCPHSSFVATL